MRASPFHSKARPLHRGLGVAGIMGHLGLGGWERGGWPCAHLHERERAHREKAPDCPLCPPWSYKLGDRWSQPVLSSGESRLSRAPARPAEALGVPGALWRGPPSLRPRTLGQPPINHGCQLADPSLAPGTQLDFMSYFTLSHLSGGSSPRPRLGTGKRRARAVEEPPDGVQRLRQDGTRRAPALPSSTLVSAASG